jgi:hypothetical protein
VDELFDQLLAAIVVAATAATAIVTTSTAVATATTVTATAASAAIATAARTTIVLLRRSGLGSRHRFRGALRIGRRGRLGARGLRVLGFVSHS